MSRHISALSTSIVGHRDVWVKQLLCIRRLENLKMRYRCPNGFNLWGRLDRGEKDFTIGLFHKVLLTVEGVPWRGEQWHISRLQRCSQHNKVSQVVCTALGVSATVVVEILIYSPHVANSLARMLSGTKVPFNPPCQAVHRSCKVCVSEMMPPLIKPGSRTWYYCPGIVWC